MDPVSWVGGEQEMQWPTMDAESAILASDGGDRDRKISGYGFILWNEDGGEVLAIGTGASNDGTETVNTQEATGLLAGLRKALSLNKKICQLTEC